MMMYLQPKSSTCGLLVCHTPQMVYMPANDDNDSDDANDGDIDDVVLMIMIMMMIMPKIIEES